MDGENLGPAHAGVFQVLINGTLVQTKDGRLTGSQLLGLGGFKPVEDHVLIKRANLGSDVVSLDEEIDLKADRTLRFYAFRTGEIFALTVNSHGFQWGLPTISEPELRAFASVPADQFLVLQRENAEPLVLGPADQVRLKATGVEHLRTESKLITVYYEGDPKEIARGDYTTEQLIATFGVPTGYLLNLQIQGGLRTLQPGKTLHVKAGMKFFKQAPSGGSS